MTDKKLPEEEKLEGQPMGDIAPAVIPVGGPLTAAKAAALVSKVVS
jgi:hypothetical protein